MKIKILLLSILVVSVVGAQQVKTIRGQFQKPTYKMLRRDLTNGKLTIIFRKDYTNANPFVWKEVYSASNGVVVMSEQITGSYTGGEATNETERIVWPK